MRNMELWIMLNFAGWLTICSHRHCLAEYLEGLDFYVSLVYMFKTYNLQIRHLSV
jgi:hypothetical protein